MQPELDAERFVVIDGIRWYRTGDLVRMESPWGMCYQGRSDRQIKFKGYRIELQDIEAAMLGVPGVAQVAVLPSRSAIDESVISIRSFWTGTELSEEFLRQQLANELPPYMIPCEFHRLEYFPVTESGKTDYREIARNYLQSPRSSTC
jgi:acyl-coenzyme A synthetase/AMP-(fatty) acid ligase